MGSTQRHCLLSACRRPPPFCCRLLVTLAALAAAIASSVAQEAGARAEGTATPQQQPGGELQLPALGPLDSSCMRDLCAQLLASMQAAAAVGCPLSEAQSRQLAPPLAPATLAAARAAISDDGELHRELLHSLDIAGAQATALLQRYPPLGQLAAAHALTEALGGGSGGAASGVPPGIARFVAQARPQA